jgi:hypothetical protein
MMSLDRPLVAPNQNDKTLSRGATSEAAKAVLQHMISIPSVWKVFVNLLNDVGIETANPQRDIVFMHELA